jgi:hypothetical protein
MNKLKFDGNNSWFVSPDSKYGLSRLPAKNITEGDFSFLAKIKVDWDKMNPNDITKQGGIIIKNGLHMGLSATKPDDVQRFIQGTIWTSDIVLDKDANNLWDDYSQSNLKNFDIFIKVDSEDTTEYEIGLIFKKEEKEFSVYCNGTWLTEKYEGNLIDYSNAWLWIGASNPLTSCPVDFREFFHGEIYKIGIFNKSLNKDEIAEIYDNFTNVSPELSPVALFDFEKQTPYKVLDISKNGNNLVKFDVTWMENI